jgi:transposase
MDILYTRCAGLDVHKRTVVACRMLFTAEGECVRETRTFTTMTGQLLLLLDWLQAGGCTHVAMESTGDYWKPVYNLLEGHLEILVVNAQHIKQVPGRKTDVKDAEWIAQLLQHGLLRASFVPPPGQRELRDLTRHRSNCIRDRAALVNRIHKVLEGANIKLGCVVTDLQGVSGRAILSALAQEQTQPSMLADLAQGRLRAKREELEAALVGTLKPHQRLILSDLLVQLETLDASIARLDTAIEEACRPFEAGVAHLDTIPGVSQTVAQIILSEAGADMSRFATPAHLASWAGVCPGNNQSGGKRKSSRTRPGRSVLRGILLQAAHAAARTKDTYLAAQYHRLATRRGKKRALMAVAHSILVIAYRVLERGEDYKDLGGDYFDKRSPDTTVHRLSKRLEQLGYQVIPLETAPAAA